MLMGILIALALLILIALISAVKLRFRYDDSVQFVRASYLILGAGADFISKRGVVYLFGIPIYRIPFERVTGIAKKKSEPKKEEKPAKKAKGFSLKGFHWRDLRIIGKLLGGIRTKNLKVVVTGGLWDPYETGKAYGYYAILQGIFPTIMSHIKFNPDFTNASLQIRGRGLIYIRTYHLVIFAVRLYLKLRSVKLGQKRLLNKKGVSYAQ